MMCDLLVVVARTFSAELGPECLEFLHSFLNSMVFTMTMHESHLPKLGGWLNHA